MTSNKIVKLKAYLSQYDCAIITGASSGIGAAFLRVLKELADFPVCDVSRTGNPEADTWISADLANSESLANTLGKLKNFVGKLSENKSPKILIINNAGFGGYGYFPMPDLSHNLRMIDLNVRALVGICGEFMPMLCEGRGAIINIASTAAFQPCPKLSVYAATKAFVYSFTRSLSYEMRGSGASCLCVCPGPTSSNFFKAAGFDSPPLPSGFGHTAKEVAEASLWALCKGKSLKVIGIANTLQSCLVRFIPQGVLLRLSGMILDKIR